ncbi:MAG: hypothetical protein L3J35_07725 [Bacteroidales bacterium]|nr:hypothetical protein [Bacteroidales bacterium]
MKGKRILLWTLGLIITLVAAVYQKMTGPTYPKKEKITLNGKEYNLKLIRSHGGDDDASIILDIDDAEVNATLYWKHYPVINEEKWSTENFKFEKVEDQNVFIAKLPHQPPAGKLMYYFSITDNKGTKEHFKKQPIVVRFKGGVPVYVIIPHVIFIFFAMFLANVAGLFAVFKIPQFKRYTSITLILMLIGGMILGPIVQKFAFLEYWAGVPFGWDLTDNKLLIAFLAWLAAFLLNRKKENRISVIIASLVTIIIFSIPHSMHGSELNRETGEVIQGFIQLYF